MITKKEFIHGIHTVGMVWLTLFIVGGAILAIALGIKWLVEQDMDIVLGVGAALLFTCLIFWCAVMDHRDMAERSRDYR